MEKADKKLTEEMKNDLRESMRPDRRMPPVLYERGDVVLFDFGSYGMSEGMIEIVDRFGTVEQNIEPSYDIYRFSDNVLYKHIRQSLVKSLVRKGDPAEIERNAQEWLEKERKRHSEVVKEQKGEDS